MRSSEMFLLKIIINFRGCGNRPINELEYIFGCLFFVLLPRFYPSFKERPYIANENFKIA